MIAVSRPTLRAWLRAAERGIESRRGSLLVFATALVLYALESVALPVIPGRDFGTYVRFYVQMWDWHSAWPMTMLLRTPLAPLVIGGPLDLAGGWAVQILMALLFAASVLAWTRVALAFGPRAALVTATALLLYPGYAFIFHELSSDSVAAAAFAGWGLSLTRAVRRPTSARFAVLGLAVAASALARPGHQVLIVSALVSLVVTVSWRRLVGGLACAAVAVVILGAWAVNNGLRYDDYTVARGGKAFFPFFRAFTSDHIVEPDNGSASRELAKVVQTRLLTEEPYRSYGVTVDTFFERGSDRAFEDVVGISDRVWGWDSDYSMLRKVGIEAVRAHPAAYAEGVIRTALRELWHPLFVALPRPVAESTPREPARSGSQRDLAGSGPRLTRPSGGDIIPAAHQGLFSTTPDGHIREVWTSPTAHTVVFDDPDDQRRHDEVETEAARLGAQVPPYSGSVWLTRQFSRSSKLFPPPLLWLAAGIAGLIVRRPAGTLLAALLALGALLITLFNAMTIYPVIEFAVPLAPALIAFGAVALVGERKASEATRLGR